MKMGILKALGLTLCMGLGSALLAGCPCQNTLQVHNTTLFPVAEVYVKYQVADDYGDNQIESNILPSQTANIADLTPGRYDVRLVYAGGGTEDHQIDILCGDTYTIETGSDQ